MCLFLCLHTIMFTYTYIQVCNSCLVNRGKIVGRREQGVWTPSKPPLDPRLLWVLIVKLTLVLCCLF